MTTTPAIDAAPTAAPATAPVACGKYIWLGEVCAISRRIRDIPVPPGYRRVPAAVGSFAAWLRDLPLKNPRAPVRLHTGALKPRQDVHHAVVDIDVGKRDLQQCADAIMRLRAEYLYSQDRFRNIRFNFVTRFTARYDKWRKGYRISVKGKNVSWVRSSRAGPGYQSFKRYLTMVFGYANTHSLSRELPAVPDPKALEIGDVFIQGGFPGHAVLAVDVARNSSGHLVFLLLQSYMPAQDMHILKSPDAVSPWYRLDPAKDLKTPEWRFKQSHLKRFRR